MHKLRITHYSDIPNPRVDQTAYDNQISEVTEYKQLAAVMLSQR